MTTMNRPAGVRGFNSEMQRIPQEAHKHLKETLTPPDHINTRLTAGCAAAIEMMMAKKRDERYPSCKEVLIDLNLLAGGQPPKYAQHGLDEHLFDGLSKGTEQERAPVIEYRTGGVSVGWMAALGIALGISLLCNIILVATR